MHRKTIQLKEMVLFKGYYEYINQPDTKESSTALYSCISSVYTKQGFTTATIETTAKQPYSCLLGPRSEVLIGHSMGASLLLQAYDPESQPLVKALVFFDPAIHFYELIKYPQLSITFFLSRFWRGDYWQYYGDAYRFEDDHYFSHSLPQIEKILTALAQKT